MGLKTLAYVLVVIIIAASAVATIAIGVSKRNKEGNPEYDHRTKKNYTRLALYYIIGTALGIATLLYLYYTL